MTPEVNRILVLRAAGLGDLLTALPALRAIRESYPNAYITAAIPKPLDAVVGDCIDDVFDVRAATSPVGLAALDTYHQQVDLAFNLHGKGPHSHRALLRRHPDRLIAYAHEDISLEGPPWVDHMHDVDRWCDLVNITLALQADPNDMYLANAFERNERLVILHPSAGVPAKRWSWQNMAALAAALRADDWDVVLTGDDSDADLVHRIRVTAGLDVEKELAGRTDIANLMALVGQARLVISGDTGIGHLATALGTPSVLLFGATDPAEWGPRRGPHHVLAARHMWDISVEAVIEAAHQQLRDANQGYSLVHG